HVVEIMRDAAGELAQRLDLLRLRELLLRALQRELRFVALGDVARDLGEADDLAVRGTDRINDEVGAEALAALAHAPVLGLVAAVLARDAERPLGHAGGALLWRIEDREMLADDFVGGVALDTLRAGIPIADIAVAVEHADRVVGDA